MKKLLSLYAAALFVLVARSVIAQSTLLDSATVQTFTTPGNDIAYDSSRNLLYVSVPSSAGDPLGNTITALDPATGAVVNSYFAGSEPNVLAISNDNSMVYVGIDGADSFRSWNPATGQFGPTFFLTSMFGNPAVAQSFAVSPTDPTTVVVSKDDVTSTASGALQIFHNSVSVGGASQFFPDANNIGFTSANTLISYDNEDTSFALKRWSFDGQNLTFQSEIDGLISGFGTRMQTAGGLIYGTDGKLVDPNTLTPLGTYNYTLAQGSSALAPNAALKRVFFFGPESFSSSTAKLEAFNADTFVLDDSKEFSLTLNGSVDRLIDAGPGRLAFVTSDDVVGIISGIQIPEATSTCLFLLGSLLFAAPIRRILMAKVQAADDKTSDAQRS